MDEDNWLDKPYFCTYWNRTDGVHKKMAEIEQIDCGRGKENNEIQRVETESEMMMMVYGDWMILNTGHVWIWASLHYYSRSTLSIRNVLSKRKGAIIASTLLVLWI
jgi:hypothetical protein